MSLPVEDPITEIKNIVIVLVMLVLLGLVAYLGYTKSVLETQVARQQTDITALQDKNSDFKNQVDITNSAIKKMQNDEASREAANTAALEAANRQATAILAEKDKLLEQKPIGDDCAAAKAFSRSYFGGHP